MLRSPSRPLAAAASLAFVYVLGACGAPDATPVPTQPAATPTGFVRVRLGASSDAQPALRGPSLLLQGSGSPVAAAFQAHLDRVASAPVDVVVLAASLTTSGSRTPECDRIMEIRGVASCETITLLSATAAREPALVAAIDRAEVVFFAGGDQCNYVGWRESPVIESVRRVYARGGGVGGGSAGLAIQGAMIYDGCTASATSSQVLANPFASSVTFSGPLFTFAPLRGIITDSHFVARDRMGRLVGFLARLATPPAAGTTNVGLGIDEGAALVTDPRGLATTFAGAAYAVRLDRLPDRCAPNASLVVRDIRVVRLLPGDTMTLSAPFANRGWLRTIDGGRFTQDPYSPAP
jgi:cyanophycinase-like exopeptidase